LLTYLITYPQRNLHLSWKYVITENKCCAIEVAVFLDLLLHAYTMLKYNITFDWYALTSVTASVVVHYNM